jgi:hypothetical protein
MAVDLIRYFALWNARHPNAPYPDDRTSSQLILQTHAAVLAVSRPDSWLAALLHNPGMLKTSLLPSMVDDELAQVMSFTDQHGNTVGTSLGWYQCSRGHMYAIGECTRPMQTATCPVEGTQHNV